MLCYFFCTQEIFGSVAPDVQRGVQVSGGIRDTRFYGSTAIICNSLIMTAIVINAFEKQIDL